MRKFYSDFKDVFGKAHNKTDPKDEPGDLIKGVLAFYRTYLKKAISKPCEIAYNQYKETEHKEMDTFVLDLPEGPKLSKTEIVQHEDYEYRILFRRTSLEPEIRKPYKTTIDLIIEGDQKTFNNLYENEFPPVLRYVLANSGTLDEARDLFQDSLVVLVEITKKKKLVINSHGIEKYLFEIARRLWYEQLRKKKDIKNFDDTRLVFEGVEVEIETYTEPDRYGDIHTEIDKLGKRCKELLYHFYYLNRDWKTITKELGYISEASARNQKYKCLQRIRKNLNNKG